MRVCERFLWKMKRTISAGQRSKNTRKNKAPKYFSGTATGVYRNIQRSLPQQGRIPLSPPNKKRNFDAKLRFFFFAQNCLNKCVLEKEKFPSEIYNKKSTLFFAEVIVINHEETYL